MASFIQAEHSRAPLDCSAEMFAYLLTFLQVMARFLDFAFTFGQQDKQKEFHYTGFRYDSLLGAVDAERYKIPKLGRSGLELQQCYNLWSVEETDSTSSGWSVRQTAVYHSFDLRTGKALWLNIKGNDLMKNRITEVTKSSSPLLAGSLKGYKNSFAATLITHLVFFEWCAENWRSYMRSLDDRLDKILTKVNAAPIKDVESALMVDAPTLAQPLAMINERSRTETFMSSASPRTQVVSRQSTFSDELPPIPRVFSGLTAATTNSFTNNVETSNAIIPPLPSKGPPVGDKSLGPKLPNFGVLNEVSVNELQKLNEINSELHEAGLVMRLDSDVLNEVISHYQMLLKETDCPSEIKDHCKADLLDFFRRVKNVMKELQMDHSRIDTMLKMSEEGTNLVRLSSPEPQYCKFLKSTPV